MFIDHKPELFFTDTLDSSLVDVIEGRKLQQALAGRRVQEWANGIMQTFCMASQSIGGDMVGAIDLGNDHIGLYSLDVSGHNIASALLSTYILGQMLGLISTHTDEHILDPTVLAQKLNQNIFQRVNSDHYCTLTYAVVNLQNGTLDLTQAGHPQPFILRKNNQIETIGQASHPIGLIEKAQYTSKRYYLKGGDRFILFSDGAAQNMDSILAHKNTSNHENLSSAEIIECFAWDTFAAQSKPEHAKDDISGLIFDYYGDKKSP